MAGIREAGTVLSYPPPLQSRSSWAGLGHRLLPRSLFSFLIPAAKAGAAAGRAHLAALVGR